MEDLNGFDASFDQRFRALPGHRHRLRPGRHAAVSGAGRCGTANGARRARARGRDVRERRVHADQDDDRQRAGGGARAARSGLRRPDGIDPRRHDACPAAHARHRGQLSSRQPEAPREDRQPGVDFRRGQLYRPDVAARSTGRRQPARTLGRSDLHRRRCAAGRAEDSRPGRHAFLEQHVHHGVGCGSRTLAGARRRLHRPRVRADVPPLRQPRDDRPGRAPTAGPRGRRRRRRSGGHPETGWHRAAAGRAR